MLISKLHEAEVDIDVEMVALMLADQYPAWAGMPLVPVASSGTDNVMLRLGDRFVVRLPRIDDAAGSLAKEWKYSAFLGPQLPAAIPAPIAKGAPGRGYPWAWTVSEWLPGENPVPGRAELGLAADLAAFVRTLHAIDVGVPASDATLSSYRGGRIDARETATRKAIADCDGLLDTALLTEVWDLVAQAPEGDGNAVWIHTDLQPGNLLVSGSRLAGVIDWGGLAIGDPAVDLIVAWNLLDAPTREAFRTAVEVDHNTWDRGRAWALSIGLVAYPYYVHTNPALARVSRYQIEQVIADVTGPGRPRL
ncbi:aminoglycoside phosphotransferase family protein [Paenarthrobacter sp. NPDC092416]|uniref:aminoglycoside phosphotransferase family protein n=1 Tax=Paenarthrobacter sp. NPDC092416 TaxID=3364386 RepID=UPI00380E6D86